MAYCLTTDLKIRGTYLNKTIPVALSNLDTSRLITMYSDEIDSELSTVGVVVPVDTTTYTRAGRRLKELCVLGVNAEIEEAIESFSVPSGEDKISRGKTFRDRYKELLKGYLAFPQKLFAGESNTAAAYNTEELIRPKTKTLYYKNTSREDPVFSMDMQF